MFSFQGIVMETFKEGYFKLHLNNNLIVDGLTCLTLDIYSIEYFKHLYGHSVTVLNNVHVRFTVRVIFSYYNLVQKNNFE